MVGSRLNPRTQITPKERKYLSERGFELVKGKPGAKAPLPYASLNDPMKAKGHYPNGDPYYPLAIESHQSENFASTLDHHPKNTETGRLVQIIECLVGENKELEGKILITQPGQIIRLYVADHAWDEVARQLAEKYPARQLARSQ